MAKTTRAQLLWGIAQVYQVVGTLSYRANVHGDSQVDKVMDWLCDPEVSTLDCLPFHPKRTFSKYKVKRRSRKKLKP